MSRLAQQHFGILSDSKYKSAYSAVDFSGLVVVIGCLDEDWVLFTGSQVGVFQRYCEQCHYSCLSACHSSGCLLLMLFIKVRKTSFVEKMSKLACYQSFMVFIFGPNVRPVGGTCCICPYFIDYIKCHYCGPIPRCMIILIVFLQRSCRLLCAR